MAAMEGTYVDKDFRNSDFSETDISDCVFVRCDMRGVKLPKDYGWIYNVTFVECLFDISYNLEEEFIISAFYEAGYRISDRVALCLYQSYGGANKLTILPEDIKHQVRPQDASNAEEDFENEGCFIGYKAVYVVAEGVYCVGIAKLSIPCEGHVIVFKSGKCRTEKAKVLEIYDFYNRKYEEASNMYYGTTRLKYRVGEEVVADSWDSNPMNVCAHGIHFFLTENEVWKYVYSL